MPIDWEHRKQREVLIDTVETGIREIMAQAEAGAVSDRPAQEAHERLEVEYVGVDCIDVRVDGWLWNVRISRRQNGYRR